MYIKQTSKDTLSSITMLCFQRKKESDVLFQLKVIRGIQRENNTQKEAIRK